jgi:hypothetical protein
MEKARLLKLLRNLSKEEWRGLKKFVRSPFCEQRKEVPALLDWLEQTLQKPHKTPDKNQAYRAVFGGSGAPDEHRVRMAMSFLFQATGQFLAIQGFLADGVQYQRQLARVYRQRGLPELFPKTNAAASALHARSQARNADHLELRYQLDLERHHFQADNRQVAAEELQALSDHLDEAYLARKLWQACAMLSHSSLSSAQYALGFLPAVLAAAEQSMAEQPPAVRLYYHCYKMLLEPSEKAHFQQFKQMLDTHGSLFPAVEMRDLYILAINFCIRQYNAGNQDYLPEQFQLYRKGLEEGYFLSEGTLSRYTYQNAATIGLVLREWDWVEHFVHAYGALLKAEHREGMVSFNLARLEYQRGQRGKALQLLQKAEYKDLLLHLAAKTLQLKIYYELGEFDLLESHLQATATFIRRKKALGYHRENYLNTVHFVQKMLEIGPYDKAGRAALRQAVEASRAVAEKEWLLHSLI